MPVRCDREVGLHIQKFRETAGTLFSELSDGRTAVKLEITREDRKGTIATYVKANGGMLDIFALTPEELLLEKAAAYTSRRKIRDVYDVYFLSKLVSGEKAKTAIRKALKGLEKPKDEHDLAALVYEGAVPSFDDMVGRLTAWAK